MAGVMRSLPDRSSQKALVAILLIAALAQSVPLSSRALHVSHSLDVLCTWLARVPRRSLASSLLPLAMMKFGSSLVYCVLACKPWRPSVWAAGDFLVLLLLSEHWAAAVSRVAHWLKSPALPGWPLLTLRAAHYSLVSLYRMRSLQIVLVPGGSGWWGRVGCPLLSAVAAMEVGGLVVHWCARGGGSLWGRWLGSALVGLYAWGRGSLDPLVFAALLYRAGGPHLLPQLSPASLATPPMSPRKTN